MLISVMLGLHLLKLQLPVNIPVYENMSYSFSFSPFSRTEI